jgi:hypothetical protein
VSKPASALTRADDGAEGDDLGDEMAGGRQRGSSPMGRRSGGGRPGRGKHMGARGLGVNGRRARVEDDDEAEV